MDNSLRLYERLFLIRSAEEILVREYGTDEIKTPLHLGVGAEAIAVGVLEACPRPRKIYGTYRSHNIFLDETGDTFSFFAELYGRVGGPSRGRAGSMHLCHPEKNLILTSAVVGTTAPLAAGHALANKLRGIKETVVVFLGDGAVEPGSFHETLNFCRLHALDILFVCEDNDLAIHTGKERRQGFDVAKLMEAYAVPYRDCEGWQLGQVMAATGELLAMPGPRFLRCRYLRFFEHVGVREDWAAGYRARPEHAERFDPVPLARARAVAKQGEAKVAEAERLCLRAIEEAHARAKESPPPLPEELTAHVFAGGRS